MPKSREEGVHGDSLSKSPARMLATENEELDQDDREAHELEAQSAKPIDGLYGVLREVHHGSVDGDEESSIAGLEAYNTMTMVCRLPVIVEGRLVLRI